MIIKTYRHANRYIEVLRILTKHGFGDLISRTGIDKILKFNLKKEKSESPEPGKTLWQRVRLMLEELGPTFIKLGQTVSNRPNSMPAELLVELEKLQSSVQTFPGSEALEIIEKELGKPINEIFKSFNETPMAAASIAQVHGAVLHDETVVVVKIQRPKIKSVIEVDLEIMKNFAELLENYYQEFKKMNLAEIVEEFEKSIIKELDFAREAMNLEKFSNNFKGDPEIYVPKCYRRYSTKKMITMEYIVGIGVMEVEELKKRGLSPEAIAARGANLILKQIFEFGFFHADPHPGNILVMRNNVICFLDYGMMGILTKSTREHLASIIIGLASHDAEKIAKTLIKFSTKGNENVNITHIESQVCELIEEHFYLSLTYMDMSAMLNAFIKILIENHLKIPSDFYLLMRALIIFQANGERLNKNFNVSEYIKPYVKKVVHEKISPFKLVHDLFNSAVDSAVLLRDLPSEMADILEKIKFGKLKMDIEHKGIEDILTTHERTTNKLSFSVILAALIIGSSIVIHSKIPPLWNGIPIIGIAGFSIASVLGFWLLISMLRYKNL